MVVMICKHPNVDKFNLSSVYLAVSGAAPLGKESTEELMAKLKISSVRQGTKHICLYILQHRIV